MLDIISFLDIYSHNFIRQIFKLIKSKKTGFKKFYNIDNIEHLFYLHAILHLPEVHFLHIL